LTRKMIGIDIGTCNIKIAEVTMNKGQVRIGAPQLVPTPRFLVQNGRISDKEELAGVLKDALAAVKSRVRKAAVIFSDGMVVTRDMELPDAKPKELEQMIKLDASQFLPYDIKEYAIRYRILVPSRENPKKCNYVLMASIRNDLAMDFHEVMKQIGLKPVAFDTTINSMLKYLKRSWKEVSGNAPDEGAVALLDLGAAYARVIILQDGRLQLQQIMNHSSQKIDVMLASSLNVERQEGEEYKKKFGLDYLRVKSEDPMAARVGGIINTQVDLMLNDVYKHINSYANRKEAKPVKKVLMAGGMSQMKGLQSYIQDALAIPCQTVRPGVATCFSIDTLMDSRDRKILEEQFPCYTGITGAVCRED
jgi:type IV pilus assembly protein PilM